MIGKLVWVFAPRREGLGQELAAGFDGGSQSFLALAPAQMIGKLAHDLIPCFLRDLLVDGMVSNQFSEMLGERYVDEYAGAALGGVFRLDLGLGSRRARHEALPEPLHASRRGCTTNSYSSSKSPILTSWSYAVGPERRIAVPAHGRSVSAIQSADARQVRDDDALAHTRPDKPAPGAACDCSPLPSHPAS